MRVSIPALLPDFSVQNPEAGIRKGDVLKAITNIVRRYLSNVGRDANLPP